MGGLYRTKTIDLVSEDPSTYETDIATWVKEVKPARLTDVTGYVSNLRPNGARAEAPVLYLYGRTGGGQSPASVKLKFHKLPKNRNDLILTNFILGNHEGYVVGAWDTADGHVYLLVSEPG
ncbi:MAG: hypothetical protein AB1942_03650 [Pseudomonadota bacterium]